MDNNTLSHIKKKQEKLLAVMKEVHSLCQSNNIKYSLCCGSLLGAVRHEGFIPWDDDMDIVFERKEYEKFVRHFPEKASLKILQDIWVPRIVSNTEPQNSKICIDIFIFDNVPDNAFLARLKVFCLKILQGTLKYDVDYSRYTFKEKLLVGGTQIIGKILPFKLKCGMYSAISQWGNKRVTAAVNAYNDLYKFLNIRYPRSIINQYEKTEFEDTELFIMNGYDEYLSLQYGDYMTLPPEEDRCPQHM